MLQRWLEGIDASLEATRSGVRTVPEELIGMTELVRRVFQEATVAPFRRYRGLFAHMIQDGIKESSLRPVDPDLASNVPLAFAAGLLTLGLLDPHGADWGRLAQDGMKMILEGLQGAEGIS